MAASSSGSLRWVIGLPVFIVFTCFLFLNAASQLLENTNPALAATLNPLNTDARINILVAELNAGNSQLDELLTQARSLVRLASADARSYSLVGAIEERRGDVAAAGFSYTAALARSRTERFALTRLLSQSLATGDVATATRYFDLLLRRWSQYAEEIVPLANDFIAKPEGAVAMKQALLRDPAWRTPVIRELLGSLAGMRFVADLLRTSPERTRYWHDDLASTINRLLSAAATGEAYALFQDTLAPDEAALSGYVYDPGFTRRPGRRAFEWRGLNSSSVDASLPAGSTEPGLRIRFLDSPATLGFPSQTLYLPRGTYKLSTTADGTGLVLPKGLFWQLRCTARRSELARLDLAADTYTAKTGAVVFSVPDNCPLQVLTLETGVTNSSWRDRYGGEIIITDVRVMRAGVAS